MCKVYEDRDFDLIIGQLETILVNVYYKTFPVLVGDEQNMAFGLMTFTFGKIIYGSLHNICAIAIE